MAKKRAETPPADPKTVAGEAGDLLRRGIGTLTRQLEQLQAVQRAKFDPKLASQAANLARALATLVAEARKQASADKKAVEDMSIEERVESIKDLITELPQARRADVLAWLSGVAG